MDKFSGFISLIFFFKLLNKVNRYHFKIIIKIIFTNIEKEMKFLLFNFGFVFRDFFFILIIVLLLLLLILYVIIIFIIIILSSCFNIMI